MLNSKQKNSIKNRNRLESSKERADIVYRFKVKLNNLLNGLSDIVFLLNELPPDNIAVSRDCLLNSMLIVEHLAKILDPWPVAEHEDHKNRGLFAFKTVGLNKDTRGDKCTIKTYYRPATPEEIMLCQRMSEHCMNLQHYFDPYIIDPVCRDLEYVKAMLADWHKTGGGIRSYFEESSKESIEPLVIEKSDLRFKRFDPQGLPPRYSKDTAKKLDPS